MTILQENAFNEAEHQKRLYDAIRYSSLLTAQKWNKKLLVAAVGLLVSMFCVEIVFAQSTDRGIGLM